MVPITLPTIGIMPYQVFPGHLNMAIDEVLLSRSEPILRFYGWENPTLSFGKSQAKIDEIDQKVCNSEKIALVKRMTGGKTVLHQYELTYSFVVDTALFPKGILPSYQLISEALSRGLRSFGIEPVMASKKKQPSKTNICFQEPSAYELTIDGKKLVGSAQYRKRERMLQHGSILLQVDWDLWKRIWRIPMNSDALTNRITCIDDQLGYTPDIKSLEKAIIESFATFFQTDTKRTMLSDEDRNNIHSLTKKYSLLSV